MRKHTRLAIKLFLIAQLLLLQLFAAIHSHAAGRVVSLAPGWSHSLAAIGGIDDLVGVTRYARFPDAIPQRVENGDLPVIGGFLDIDVDKVLSLDPSLVLTATSMQLELKRQFEEAGIQTLHIEESSVAEVYEKLLALGRLTQHENQAARLVEDLRQQILSIQAGLKGKPVPRVYYELNYYYKCAPGRDSYVKELIELAGGEPVFGDREGTAPLVSWQEVISENPDVILIPTWPDAQPAVFQGPNAGNGTTTPEEVKGRTNAATITAVIQDRVLFIDSAVTKQPGPDLAKAVRLLAEAIHPENCPQSPP